MDYKKFFRITKTDVPKTLEELFINHSLVIVFNDNTVVEINIPEYENVYWESFNNLEEYLDYINLNITDLNNYIDEDQERNLRKLIPNIKEIFGLYV